MDLRIFTLLTIPQFYACYKECTTENYTNLLGSGSFAAMFNLWNYGYSTVDCVRLPVELGKIGISCNYGYIGEIYSYGITNFGDSNPEDQCMINDFNAKSQPNSLEI